MNLQNQILGKKEKLNQKLLHKLKLMLTPLMVINTQLEMDEEMVGCFRQEKLFLFWR